MLRPMRRSFPTVLVMLVFLALGLVTGVPAAAKKPSPSQLYGCVETVQDAKSNRDLKLRETPCKPGELPVAWPPSGAQGAARPTGPQGALVSPARPVGWPDRPGRPQGAEGGQGPQGVQDCRATRDRQARRARQDRRRCRRTGRRRPPRGDRAAGPAGRHKDCRAPSERRVPQGRQVPRAPRARRVTPVPPERSGQPAPPVPLGLPVPPAHLGLRAPPVPPARRGLPARPRRPSGVATIVVRSAAFTNATTASVSCQGSERATSGGFDVTTSNDQPARSRPLVTDTTPTGWELGFYTNASGTVYVVCAA